MTASPRSLVAPVVPDGFVLIERIAVENFARSTDVPRFKRMCEAALSRPAQPSSEQEK